jgi:uncharacterized protein (DUF3820 family)
MESPALPSPELLRALLEARMPFGKYKGRLLLDLPEAYLVWFRLRGFPSGALGLKLLQVLELKENGLMPVLRPLLSGRGQSESPPRGK